MYIYHIILDFNYPFDTEAYRTAPQIELREAQWIVRTFPFEEPEYLKQHPEEGPAPHILFVNQKSDYFLVISYEGNSRYEISFGKANSDHQTLSDLGARELKEAISFFWDQHASQEDIWKNLQSVHHKYTYF